MKEAPRSRARAGLAADLVEVVRAAAALDPGARLVHVHAARRPRRGRRQRRAVNRAASKRVKTDLPRMTVPLDVTSLRAERLASVAASSASAPH